MNSTTDYDPRLHALALHLGEMPDRISKVEPCLYRVSLEPDSPGKAPRSAEFFVLTMNEAQKRWDYADWIVDVTKGLVGPYHIFEA